MLARPAYSSSVDLRKAARAIVIVVVLDAVAVTWVSSISTPKYEAFAQVWVDQSQRDQSTNFSGSGEEVQTLPPSAVEGLQNIVLTMIHAIDSRPVAEEAIQRLGLKMSPEKLLDNLTIEQVESTSFIVLTYKGTDPQKAQQIVNTLGKVSSELISERSARSPSSRLTATLYEPAVVPESPVSPDPLRNGLLTLVIGLMLCAGPVRDLPSVASSLADKLGGQAVRQGVGEAGAPADDPSEPEGLKEKELLLALARCGKLTAVGASLETSLSVEEAERMLEALAAKGHLEVTVEHGRLLYSLWERDASGGL